MENFTHRKIEPTKYWCHELSHYCLITFFLSKATTTAVPLPDGYDIVLMMDSSVQKDQFNGWMKRYAKRFVNQLSLDDDQYRLGLLRFGSDANIQFNMNKFDSKADILNAVDNVKFKGSSGTDVAKALDTARQKMFRPRKGDRDYARNYIVLLTGNERSDDTNEAWAAAERAEDDGIGIYVVGYGINDRTELDQTSSHPLSIYQYIVGDEQTLDDVPFKLDRAVKGCKFNNSNIVFFLLKI